MDNRAAFQSEGGKRRLLVVEDEAINRAILGEILAKDYEVLFAEDGERALALATEKFIRRFCAMEELMRQEGRGFAGMTLAEMDEYWNRVKRRGGPACDWTNI